MLPTVHEKSLSYRTYLAEDVPAQVHGDLVHLRQVLLNLIGNAVKFTDKGRVSVDVSLSAPARPEGYRLRFEVADSGIGIPTSEQDRLFEAFEQVDAGLRADTAAPGWARPSPRAWSRRWVDASEWKA